MGQQQQRQYVRFTPDELKEIAADLTPEDIAKMHPDDQKVAIQLSDMAQGPDGNLHKTNSMASVAGYMVPAVAGGLVGGLGLLGNAAKATIPYGKAVGAGLGTYIGMEGGRWALNKMGLPSSMSEMLPFMVMMGMAGKGAPPAAATGAAEAGALTAAEEAALAKQGYSGSVLDRIKAATQKQQGRAPAQQNVRNLGTKYAENDDLMSRVVGGGASVAPGPVSTEMLNDAERRVFGSGGGAVEARTMGVKPPAYPSNVHTGASMDDITEAVTRSSSTGQPSPLVVHDDPELAAIIRRIKNLKRRSPQ